MKYISTAHGLDLQSKFLTISKRGRVWCWD